MEAYRNVNADVIPNRSIRLRNVARVIPLYSAACTWLPRGFERANDQFALDSREDLSSGCCRSLKEARRQRAQVTGGAMPNLGRNDGPFQDRLPPASSPVPSPPRLC